MNKPTLFVIDQDTDSQRTLQLLAAQSNIPITFFNTAQSFLDTYSIHQIGCLLIDLQLPDIPGQKLLQKLNQYKYSMPIMIMTNDATVSLAVKTIKNGAAEFFEKPLMETKLIKAAQQALVLDKKRYQRRLQHDAVQARVKNLTPREHEVLNFVIHGYTNRKIADNLGVSVKTIEFHRSRVMQKMHAHSLLELADMIKESEIPLDDTTHQAQSVNASFDMTVSHTASSL